MARRSTLISFQQVELVLHSLPVEGKAVPEQLEALAKVLESFIADHEHPAPPPPPGSSGRGAPSPGPPVRLDALLTCAARRDVQPAVGLVPSLLRTAKVLTRRADVRQACSARVVAALLNHCDGAGLGPTPPAGTREAVNALLNLMHEPQNVAHLLAAKGEATLLKLLCGGEAGDAGDAAEELLLQTTAAAALQTVSFQQDGRTALLKAGAVGQLLVRLEAASDDKLQERLVRTLQNLSTEGAAVLQIRQGRGILLLARLLSRSHEGCLAAGAGALQNLSREEASREEILATADAVPRLVALLGCPNMQAAVCAAGTLTNLLSTCSDASIRRQAVGAMAGLLAGGVVRDAVYG